MPPPPRKKPRKVYVHDPAAENVSTTSTATNVRLRFEHNPAPPASPEKRRTYDVFDRAMGYNADDAMFLHDGAESQPTGPAGIKVKKKARRNRESVGVFLSMAAAEG